MFLMVRLYHSIGIVDVTSSQSRVPCRGFCCAASFYKGGLLCRKSTRHYERPSLQWPPPTSSELVAAQTLEEQMRQQLSSIASFNETERMVLLKQFDVQARWAKSQAHRLHNPNACPPSGLLSVDQFIAAWHNLSIKVC